VQRAIYNLSYFTLSRKIQSMELELADMSLSYTGGDLGEVVENLIE
jgi:hypothetical protein